MITKFIIKIPGREVEDAAIQNNEMRLWIFSHLIVRRIIGVTAVLFSETPAERGAKPNRPGADPQL